MAHEALEARVGALERELQNQGRRLDNHGDRLNDLEQRTAAREATEKAMQQDIGEAKLAAKEAAEGVNSLQRWMLGVAAMAALNLLYMILRGAMP